MKKLLLINCAALAFAATGCKTTTATSDGNAETGGGGKKRPEKATNAPPNADGTPAQPEISAAAKLKFEDANKFWDDQKKKGGKIDFTAAKQKYAAAAAADDQLAEAIFNEGVISEREGKVKEAVAYYKDALSRKPTLKQAAINLAVIAQNGGDEAGAIAIYEDVQKRYPDDASSRARLAEIYRRKGECEKGVDLAKEALFREPHTLQAYKVLMLCAYEAKQFSMARLVALRASKIDDNDPEIFYTLGQINLLEKEPAKARVQFKKAVEARADFLPAHLQLAKMAMDTEDYTAAEDSLRRILQANGNNPEALVNLGIAYKGLGQFDKALQAYDAAAKIKPDMPEVALGRGFVAGAKGTPEKAIEYFNQYMQMKGGQVDDKHPVREAIKDQQAIIQKREDDKKAAEEAAKMEAEAKKAEDEAAAAEKKQKEEELKKSQQDAKGSAVKDASKGVDTGEAKPEGKDPKGKGGKPDAKGAPKADETKPAADGKPAEEPKKEEPKKEEAKKPPAAKPADKPAEKAAPAKAAPKGDEPADGL
jgi:tetratricopeptide (TPR) repeat protein